MVRNWFDYDGGDTSNKIQLKSGKNNIKKMNIELFK